MSEEKVGIKETKEVLDGLNAITLEIVKVSKDGFQVGKDVAAIVSEYLSSPELRSKLTSAVNNIQAVPAEIKDLDLMEGVELAKFEYDAITNIIAELKK